MNSSHRNKTRLWLGWGAPIAGVLLILVVCCQKAQEPQTETDKKSDGPPLFQEQTTLCFTYHNGEEADHYAILESLGGGVGLIDYDGDGLLDIVFAGGGYFDGPDKKQIKGHSNRLYKNLGDFKFKDVTRETGLDQAPFFSHAVAVADYDRDGWPDLLITGYGGIRLYRNVAAPDGTRRFVDVTRTAGLAGGHFWGTGAAWADFDGDGFPDLYVCQYVDWSWENNPRCKGFHPSIEREICVPRVFKARPHALFRNDGNGRFVNVSASAGIRVDRQDEDYGKALGVVAVDLNGDGKPDIYVANDTSGNLLYMNRSRPGQILFDDVGVKMGVARDDAGTANASMGTDAGDPFGTGWPALWCTNYEGELHGLYQQTRHGAEANFFYATRASGIAAIGQEFVGWGTAFTDLDNDGWEDIVICNGHVIRHPMQAPFAPHLRKNTRQKPVLLHNKGKGKFRDISVRGGPYFQDSHRGRGLAVGDLNNDGFPDLVISHLNEPAAILRNETTANHWLGVTPASKDNHTFAGTKLVLEVAGRTLTRFAKGGGSYLSSSDPRIIFGLAQSSTSGKLTIEWNTGTPRTEHWDNLAIDQYHRLVQGSGTR